MNNFWRRGLSAPGVVGVLAMVLMVGVLGLTAFSALNKPTSNDTHASQREAEDIPPTIKVNLTAENRKVNLNVTWRQLKSAVKTDKVTVSIHDYVTRKKIDSIDNRVLGYTATEVNYRGLSLPVGKYFVLIRYIPTDANKTVKQETGDFDVVPSTFNDQSCIYGGFYKNVSTNKPGQYNMSLGNHLTGAANGDIVVVYAYNSSKTPMPGVLNASLKYSGITFKPLDSDNDCHFNGSGFSCNLGNGAARYKIENVPQGYNRDVTLNYTAPGNDSRTPLRCGPFMLTVVGQPPP